MRLNLVGKRMTHLNRAAVLPPSHAIPQVPERESLDSNHQTSPRPAFEAKSAPTVVSILLFFTPRRYHGRPKSSILL